MASQAVRAHGTLLLRSNHASGWNIIAEQVNIDYTSSREEINISIHNEPDANTNWLAGPMNTEIGFTANFLANDATHNAATGLLALYNSGGSDTFAIQWNMYSPALHVQFVAFPKSFNMPMPAGEPAALQFTTSMRVNGALTWF